MSWINEYLEQYLIYCGWLAVELLFVVVFIVETKGEPRRLLPCRAVVDLSCQVALLKKLPHCLMARRFLEISRNGVANSQ